MVGKSWQQKGSKTKFRPNLWKRSEFRPTLALYALCNLSKQYLSWISLTKITKTVANHKKNRRKNYQFSWYHQFHHLEMAFFGRTASHGNGASHFQGGSLVDQIFFALCIGVRNLSLVTLNIFLMYVHEGNTWFSAHSPPKQSLFFYMHRSFSGFERNPRTVVLF